MKKVLTLSLAATLATSSVAFAHGGGAKFFERLDGNGDGRVTQQEMLSHKLAWFDAADANEDGKLTPEERKAAFEKFVAEHPKMAKRFGEGRGKHRGHAKGPEDSERAKKHKERMEATWQRGEVKAHVAERFAKLDANGDGALTPDEMRHGHGRGHGKGHGHGWGHGRGRGHGPGNASTSSDGGA